MKGLENTNDSNQKLITDQAVAYLGLSYRKVSNSESYNVNCPFHKDKTPSMFIEPSTGRYHCFSCGRGGHISGLFKSLTGTSMYRALGLSNDNFTSFSRQYNYSYDPKEDMALKNVNVIMDSSQLASPFTNDLCNSYLKNRGISKDIVRKYGLMYADNTSINTTPFRQRLVIPIYEGHKLISLEGRRLVDDGSPKVLYPKNCTTNSLFDIDNLDRSKPLYVVEGLMDLFVLKSCPEFSNSTAIFGASLTKRQQELLSEFKEGIIFIPDSDEAGQKPLEAMKSKNLSYLYSLKLPKQVNGKEIKDVGDLPKVGATVQDLVDRNWLSYIVRI